MSVAFMAFMGSMILLPLYLQGLRGLTRAQTGLLMMPGGLAMGLLGPRVGALFDRFGTRPLVIPGASMRSLRWHSPGLGRHAVPCSSASTSS